MYAYLRLVSVEEDIEGDANLHTALQSDKKCFKGNSETFQAEKGHLLYVCPLCLREDQIIFTHDFRSILP